jgi:hypothetical protein
MNIKANELRIGNYAYREGLIVTVDGRSIMDADAGLVAYQPIPLTEEWLVKVGFNENYSSGVKKKYFHHSLLYNGGNALAYVIYSKEPEKNGILFWGNAVPLCYNVHQLQNLFHALTGQELTITA